MRLGAEVLLALIVAWTLGGVILRLGGVALVTVGLAGLGLGGGPIGIVLVGGGAALWMTGQAHSLLRHGECQSPLARLLFERPARRGSTDDRWTARTSAETRPSMGRVHRAPAPRGRRRG